MYLIWGLFRYWKFFTILGMAGFIAFGMWQVEKIKSENNELKLQIQEKVFYLESLEDAVDIQNNMISDLEKNNKVVEDKLDTANKRIVTVKRQEKKKIQDILNASTGGTCESNFEFLLKQAQENKTK